MEANGEKPDRKHSKREMKASSKSATLPPGAMLMAHPGEGFFTKIRRCLRLRSKGKYDFSHTSRHPDADGVSMSTSRSRSSNSPAREEGDVSIPNTKSSPVKASTRRSKSDKEEVLLIRKDKKSSSGMGFTTKTVEGMRDDILVVTVGEDRADTKENEIAGASAMCVETENKQNDEVFEDFDPDYETLDDIRRKVRSQAENGVDTSTVQSSPASSHHKTPVRQPLQVKIKTNADLNGQDSGLGSPFTDSPGSSRESQAHSVTSSVFSSSVASSNTSEPFKEPSMSSVVFVDKIPQTTDSDPMVTSSTSCCSNSALEEDDLYSNAKVLIRKKSQKQSQSQTSLSTSDQQSSGLLLDQPRSARNSLSPADFLAMIEAENPEPLAPPPLPARNYSEEDINTEVKKHEASDLCSTSEININNVHPSSGTDSDALHNYTDVRPKTSSRPNAVIENGPSIAINSFENITYASDGESVPSELTLSATQNTPTPLTPTNNIYEDIPDRAGINTLKTENKTGEDDLMYIDDDLSIDGECQTDRTNSSDLPEDIMIVSASDSCCGNDTDDSQGNQVCSVSEETEVQSPNELNPPEVDSSSTGKEPFQEAVVAADLQEESDVKYDIEDGIQDTPGFGACPMSDLRENSSRSLNITTSSSHLSTSSSSASSPLSASSSDTLNNLMDDPDPDDFEGKDLSPPVGPPIHISHQQLLRHLNARTRGEDMSSESGQEHSSVNVGARNARSVEIPRCHFAEQGDEAASDASNIRRHSSSAAAAAASSHRDFLESMKQLKDIFTEFGPKVWIVEESLMHEFGTERAKVKVTRANFGGRNAHWSDYWPHCAGIMLLHNLYTLFSCGWYWGPLSYEEAESKLIDKRDGSFLVRDSSNENYILSLSFKSMGQVHHTRIEHHKGLFSFWSQPDSHGKAQICQFIEQTVENSKNGRFLYFLRPAGPGSPPLPIQLLYPVSRFFRVPSLQHMCRFLVLRRVRRDHIDFLPLPQKVKAYLLEKQYYVETLEED